MDSKQSFLTVKAVGLLVIYLAHVKLDDNSLMYDDEKAAEVNDEDIAFLTGHHED
jgi:hypothetical protein